MKILIIDDEISLTEVLKERFESLGVKSVSVAYDGQSGMDKIENENFDLICVDFLMPKCNGDEFVTFLRSRCRLMSNRSAMVLFITAVKPKLDLENEKKWDNVYFINKPFADSTILFYFDLVRNQRSSLNS